MFFSLLLDVVLILEKRISRYVILHKTYTVYDYRSLEICGQYPCTNSYFPRNFRLCNSNNIKSEFYLVLARGRFNHFTPLIYK